jgi:cell division protein FtsW (lipid II flippase)
MWRSLQRLDRVLVAALASILALSVYNLSSAGQSVNEDLYLMQAAYMVVGVVVIAVVTSIDYRNLEVLAVPLYGAVVTLLAVTLFAGKVVNGSRRWLYFGPLGLQTSDLAKLAVVVITAKVLHAHPAIGGGFTLRELFRPLNVSRPLVIVFAVLVVTVGGDRVVKPTLKQRVGGHSRTLLKVDPSRPSVLVGRGGEAQLEIPGAGLEPEHARFERRGDGDYALVDLGTAAGTWINGERVEGERALHDGDTVRFGLSPRGELQFSASLEKLRPVRSVVAIVGAVWLALALALQLRRGRWDLADLVAPVDVILLPAALVLVQPDLGTASVIVLVAFTVIVFAGVRPLSLVALALGSGGLAYFAWHYVLKGYQKQRILTFLDPTADLSGAGYHQNQSLIAIGSGGQWGKGHGQGTQTQLSFLPEQQTDFIFSVWSEEQGFVGCVLLVALYVTVILLAYRVALTAKDRFGALLAVGMTAIVFWHTLINMLMVLHLAPVVGVPLPFFSYGGSFALTAMTAVGVVLGVAMRRTVF